MLSNTELADYIGNLLDVSSFSDYSINGLQVEGRRDIKKIVTSTTASLDAINAAVELNADALLVHHGLLWKGAVAPVAGAMRLRYKALLENNINLFAYHLPLDANMELGNNRYLCDLVDVAAPEYLEKGNPQSIGMQGILKQPSSVADLAHKLTVNLKSPVQVLGRKNESDVISSVAVCSGSGSFIVDDNTNPGFDALITGDVKEQTFHFAAENNIAVFAVGHHASEQGGIANLGSRISHDLNLEVIFKSFSVEADSKIYDFR